MNEGATEFFTWALENDAHIDASFMPACGELELKIYILGEGEFYMKRAGSFKSALPYVKKFFERKRNVPV